MGLLKRYNRMSCSWRDTHTRETRKNHPTLYKKKGLDLNTLNNNMKSKVSHRIIKKI